MVADNWRVATVLRQGGSDPDHRDDIALLAVAGADITINKLPANTWEIVLQAVDTETGEVTRTIELHARYVSLWSDSDGEGGGYERMSEERFKIWQQKRDQAAFEASIAKRKADEEAAAGKRSPERQEPWWQR